MYITDPEQWATCRRIDAGHRGPYTTDDVRWWWASRTEDATPEGMAARPGCAPAAVESVAREPIYYSPDVPVTYTGDGIGYQPDGLDEIGWYDLTGIPTGGHVGRISSTGTDRTFTRTGDDEWYLSIERAAPEPIADWERGLL